MRRILLALLIMPLGVTAQIQDSVKQADVMRFADGVINTYTSPIRWQGKDWINLGAVLGGTAALTLADKPVRNFWKGQDSNFLDQVNSMGYHYGKPYSAFLFSGSFYITGLLFQNEWARETGIILGAGTLTAGLLEMVLKPAIGRARPEREKGNYEMTFFNKEASFHSFPSGHASIAFTISFIMARRVKSVPLKIGFYSLAASTAVCRLYMDAHWISDIAFGGAIAWFCSDFVIKRLESNTFRSVRPKKIKWNVSPYASGLTIRGSF